METYGSIEQALINLKAAKWDELKQDVTQMWDSDDPNDVGEITRHVLETFELL